MLYEVITAVYTLYEGVGSVASIDSSMKLGANHPMGPLELADFIGLDTCLAVMHVLYEGRITSYNVCYTKLLRALPTISGCTCS